MIWIVFIILLTVWLLALIAGGFGGLIHSLITLFRSEAKPATVLPADTIQSPEVHF